MYWNITFVALLALAFLTRLMDDYSRASMVLFYVAGLPALLLMRYALVSTVILGSRVGLVTAQRVFLIGTGEDICGFVRRYQPWNFGLHTVGAAPLTRLDSFATREERRTALDRRPAPGDRQRAHAAARRGLHRHAVVRDRHDRLLRRRIPQDAGRDPSRAGAHPRPLRQRAHRQARPDGEPAAHARAAQLVRADAQAHLRRDGRGRRADRALAAAACSPRSSILLESGRPLFFRQRRYGFNQQEFRIIKFRTMTTLDDGDVVRQARRNDPRITRLGALPAQVEHRRAAAAHQRAQGRHVAGRPAPARALAQPRIRAEDRALCAPPQRAAGHHRLGAGQRLPRRDRHRRQDARAASITISITSTTGRSGSTCASCCGRCFRGGCEGGASRQ